MLARRCAVVFVEPREHLDFDPQSLADGGDGLAVTLSLVALAPHLADEVEIDATDVALLAQIAPTTWIDYDELLARHPAAALARLVEKGLLISNADAHTAMRLRDEAVRDANWRPLAAVAHHFGRWTGVRSGEEARRAGVTTFAELTERLGPPPPAVRECTSASARIALERAAPTAFDELLRRRATCRNFDTQATLPRTTFATMLERVFAAHATVAAGGATVLKRGSPSGGALHPTEAYLIVQRVDGVAPGLYHYHAIDHALEPLRTLPPEALADFALRAVAAQDYFADAPVLVVLASRFGRSFWKYRQHAKAYRVVTLDAGHLSQTLYLAATDLRLGAFVTGAINEIEIEEAFGLDPLAEGVLAVCGFGARGEQRTATELDPLGYVWDANGERVKA